MEGSKGLEYSRFDYVDIAEHSVDIVQGLKDSGALEELTITELRDKRLQMKDIAERIQNKKGDEGKIAGILHASMNLERHIESLIQEKERSREAMEEKQAEPTMEFRANLSEAYDLETDKAQMALEMIQREFNRDADRVNSEAKKFLELQKDKWIEMTADLLVPGAKELKNVLDEILPLVEEIQKNAAKQSVQAAATGQRRAIRQARTPRATQQRPPKPQKKQPLWRRLFQ